MRGIMEFLRHPFGVVPAQSLGLAANPAPTPAPQPAASVPPPGLASTKCKVEFDANGKVTKIEVQPDRWAFKQRGQNRYYSQSAHSLLLATEILKKLDSIPELTYYVVDTPDGSLGRDIQGFYTEAALKTENLILETNCDKSPGVEFSGLKGFGDMFKNQTSVALLRKSGGYARLVLMMKCGRCGYESPVETEPGRLVRQCYCCGVENKGNRGKVNVVLDSGVVQI